MGLSPFGSSGEISPEFQEQSLRLGDLSFGARWTLLHDTMQGLRLSQLSQTWKPFLDILGAVRLPTGQSSDRSTQPLQTDVSGTGSYQLGFGFKSTKFLHRHLAIQMGGNYLLSLEDKRNGFRYQPGNEAQGTFNLIYVKNLATSFAFGGSYRQTGTNRENGVVLTGSETRRSTLTVGATLPLRFPHWELGAAFSWDPWWEGWSENVSYTGLGGNLSVRRNFTY